MLKIFIRNLSSDAISFLHPLSELKRALNLRQLRTDMAGADVTGTSLVAGAAVEN
jgi:hypothetical protein